MVLLVCGCSFIDLDTPLLLSEDPVYGGYEGILTQNPVQLQFPFCKCVTLFIYTVILSVCFHAMPQMSLQDFVFENHSIL